MTHTPRTDALQEKNIADGCSAWESCTHYREHARQLERENAELVEALETTQSVLAMLTDPERIKQSRVQVAWAQAIAAEAKARAVLSKVSA